MARGTHHPHDPEVIECRECSAQFDLARQNYYDNLCPECKHEKQMESAMDERAERGL
jgi:Zn finger protein HypA/HybF involved in hydrogenase expression